MIQQNTIAPQIFVLALYITIMWAIYFSWTIRDYVAPLTIVRPRVAAFRRLLVALCVFAFPASVLLRTGLVLLGVGEDTIGQLSFFVLAGTNVVGSTYAVVSLIFD